MKIFLERAWFWGQKEYRGERENDFSALQGNSGWKGPRRALVQPPAPRGSALDHPGLCRLPAVLESSKDGDWQPAPLTSRDRLPPVNFCLLGSRYWNQEQMWPVEAFETILLLWRGRNEQLWVLGGQNFVTCLLCFGRVFISLSQWSCSSWWKISLGRVCWLHTFRKTANRNSGWCGPHCLLCMGEHRTGFLFVSYLFVSYSLQRCSQGQKTHSGLNFNHWKLLKSSRMMVWRSSLRSSVFGTLRMSQHKFQFLFKHDWPKPRTLNIV